MSCAASNSLTARSLGIPRQRCRAAAAMTPRLLLPLQILLASAAAVQKRYARWSSVAIQAADVSLGGEICSLQALSVAGFFSWQVVAFRGHHPVHQNYRTYFASGSMNYHAALQLQHRYTSLPDYLQGRYCLVLFCSIMRFLYLSNCLQNSAKQVPQGVPTAAWGGEDSTTVAR